MRQLVAEMGIVGLALAVVLASMAWLWPASLRSPASAAATGLVLGALVHAGFELSGLNAVYCTVGHACAASQKSGDGSAGVWPAQLL